MRRIGRAFPLLVADRLLIPTLAGFVLDGFTVARRAARAASGAGWCGSSWSTT